MKPKLEPKPSTDSKNQIESELKRTRRELENTKNALKHQVARCRHLVSAFSKKLAEKDVELKYCKETREKQLSAVIRALLVLESRLRREQKSIRTMLAERDGVIKSQCEEIARLESGHDPDWASKLVARDAIIAARDEEITRLRSLCQPSLDSSDETDSVTKSILENSDRLSFIDEMEAKDDLKKIIEEKDAQIKHQNEEIKRLQSLSVTSNDFNEEDDLRTMLSERDALIKFQQNEIERLRSLSMSEVTNESKEINLTKIDEIVEDDVPNVECYAKPDLISSLCIDGQDEKESSTESVTEVACQPDSLSSDAASTRACLGDNDADSLCNCTITPPVVRGGLSVHDRSAFSPVPRSSHKYDPEPMAPNMFSSSVPDISKSDYSSRFEPSVSSIHEPQNSSYYSSNTRPSPSSARVSMRSFDVNYQDNPVLQCVNQILLKDPDDIMEDQRSNKLPSIESPFVEIDDADQPFWLTNSTEEEPPGETTTQTLEDSPKPALATSSPLEKSCVQESSNPPKGSKLSLSKLIELHNAARKLFPSRREHDGRKSVSMTDLSSAVLAHRSNPPVPPKPRKSGGKRVDFNINRPSESKSADNSFHNSKTVLPPQPVYIDRTKLDIISKPSPLPFAGAPSTENEQDNELYVISNSALDDEILQKLKGKNLKSFEIKLHRLAGEAMMQQQARRQHSGLPEGKLHPNHKPTLNKAMLSNINLLEAAAMLRQLREASDPRRTADGKQAMSPSMSQKARLRVAASVAQLLAQAQQQAREQQLRAQAEMQMKTQAEQKAQADHSSQGKTHSGTPSKAQVEHLKAQEFQMKMHAEQLRAQAEQHLKVQTELIKKIKDQHLIPFSEQQPSTSSSHPSQSVPPPPPLPSQPPPPLSPRESPNFSQMSQRYETIDDESQSEEHPDTPPDSETPVKDDDASTSSSNEKSPGTYDNFLEATGLSQKSIMTPSRMLNNHRSVVKPKDVKLRNKVRNAAIFERTIPPQVVGPTIKYWTEPYL